MTGGHGRIGRRLIRELTTRGARHVVVPNVNILDAAALKKALRGCTAVFHLAALTRVNDSDSSPMPYLQTNGWGVTQLLDVCRELKIRHIIYTSSALVYGRPTQLPVKESHPTRPLSIYAASKLLGEAALQGYAEHFGFSCEIARLSNVYGSWIDKTTVIGSALAQAMSGRGVIALKNLNNVRDFIHVDDVVEALLRLAAAGHKRPGCRAVNVSTGRGVSIREFGRTLTRLAKTHGMGTLTFRPLQSRQSNPISKLVLDNHLLRATTGWSPHVTLADGLSQALTELQS